MIIPEYDEYFKFEDFGLTHSYINTPPGYTNPQILYKFHYEGIISKLPNSQYVWSIDPPFFIIDGQGTNTVTLELQPKLTKDREDIIQVTGITGIKYTYRELKYCSLNLKMNTVKGIFTDVLDLKYKQGPLWKIEGNRNPQINKVTTYTLIPQYDQIGFPPKNTTDPNSYSFDIKNGRIIKFYGGNAPKNNKWTNNFPMIDVEWYQIGSAYLSFYSSWTNEIVKFPNTLGIIVS